MMRVRRLRWCAAILVAVTGMMMIAISPARADTGAGGITILHASSDQQAHVCNLISLDASYRAVVCADILTYEGASDYYAYARAELICQTASQVEVACKSIAGAVELATGSGSTTGWYTDFCGPGACPDARYYILTRTWEYSISAVRNGTCSSNVDSAYQVWTVVLGGGGTKIQTPDGVMTTMGASGTRPPNDSGNESSGHFFICP